MRYLFLASFVAAMHLPQVTVAQVIPSSLSSGWRPYVGAQAWAASDAVAIKEFDSDWTKGFSPKNGHNATVLRIRGGIGMENEHWSIGWEARQEASLHTDRETLEMVRLYKQKTDPAANTRFDARVRYRSWSAQGLRVGHWFDIPAIAGKTPRVKVSAAFYTKPEQRDTRVSGSVHYDQTGTYNFNASQTDANSRHTYPFMGEAPNGSGTSLSVAMDWPLAESLSLKLKANDLWSRIKWDDFPVMERTINSDVVGRDSEGYVNYRPTLSGRNRQISKSFSIPRSYSALLSYRSGAWGFSGEIERWSAVTIPMLSMTRHFGWGSVTANVETRFKSAGIGLLIGKFRFQLQSDSLHLNEAKAFGLHLSYLLANI